MKEEYTKYLIQVKKMNGTEYTNLIPWPAIVDMFCDKEDGDEIRVYDVSDFGFVEPLYHETRPDRPNWHVFLDHYDASIAHIVFQGGSPDRREEE